MMSKCFYLVHLKPARVYFCKVSYSFSKKKKKPKTHTVNVTIDDQAVNELVFMPREAETSTVACGSKKTNQKCNSKKKHHNRCKKTQQPNPKTQTLTLKYVHF